jgi:hypothetical protein
LNLISSTPIHGPSFFKELRNDFTYEFWIKPPESLIQLTSESYTGITGVNAQKYLIGPACPAGKKNAGIGISVGSNGVSVFEHSRGHLPSVLVFPVQLTSWVHIAIVYRNKTPYLYIDGKFKKAGLRSIKSNVFASKCFMKHKYGNFAGEIKEIRLWNHSRTQEQIELYSNYELTGNEEGLFGVWKLEGPGEAVELSIKKGLSLEDDQKSNLSSENLENKNVNVNGESSESLSLYNSNSLKVSCILTSYNRPERVQEAIASVMAQTYSNWELIIVDDNSNQQTQKILSQIVVNDDRCKLIQTGVQDADRGTTTRYATCINIALRQISGDLVTYLTDDDIYYPRRFEKMVELFESNPDIQVVYGRQRVIWKSNNKLIKQFIRPLIGITRSPMGKVDHNSVMHRRSCFNKVIGWDDHPSLWKMGDAAFFRKLAKYWSFYPLDAVTDEHRIHDKGIQRKISRGLKPWEENDAE